MKRVITYGTFDLFHKGHYNILKRAKEEGDYLIVGVTGERYDAERGKLSVQDSLATRIENVRKTGFADKIIVEEYLGQKIPDILKYDVDVLVIGSDWKGKFDHLNKYCEVKYLERTKNISSTQIREEQLKIFSLGIATDDLCDNGSILESKSVSGIHAENVFAADKKIAEQFAEKYELDSYFDDYDKFLDDIEIVYIKTDLSERKVLAKRALEKGKNVICDAPVTLDIEEEKELEKLAYNNGVFLIRNIPMSYLQAFGQLLWMARGNIIGDIVAVKTRISRKAFSDNEKMCFEDVVYYAACAVVKILGTGFNDCVSKLVKDENENIIYGSYMITYDNSIAEIDVGMNLNTENSMEIIGTNGSVVVPEEWWLTGFFKLNEADGKCKRYSSNLEGNGFRYLLQALQRMIRTAEGTAETSQGITDMELQAIQSILVTGIV